MQIADLMGHHEDRRKQGVQAQTDGKRREQFLRAERTGQRTRGPIHADPGHGQRYASGKNHERQRDAYTESAPCQRAGHEAETRRQVTPYQHPLRKAFPERCEQRELAESRRKGVRILVIDPMNRLEQRLEPGQTEMDYITDTLNKLGRFATRNQCLVILVAHPRKVNRNEKDGTRRRVEMNDINGSANFANMSDFCLVVDRNDTKQIATIYIEKVRFKHLGSAHTEAKFVYNHLNGRYWPCEEDVIHTPQGEQLGPVNTQFDNENWLKNNEEQGRLFE